MRSLLMGTVLMFSAFRQFRAVRYLLSGPNDDSFKSVLVCYKRRNLSSLCTIRSLSYPVAILIYVFE